MRNVLLPEPNPKRHERHHSSFMVVEDEKCSNLSFTLGSISQHDPDLWTPESFHSVPCPCVFIGFIFHHLK